MSALSSPRHLSRIVNFFYTQNKDFFGEEMEGTEDITMGVQLEEEMCVIREMQIVTKLWVSVR